MRRLDFKDTKPALTARRRGAMRGRARRLAVYAAVMFSALIEFGSIISLNAQEPQPAALSPNAVRLEELDLKAMSAGYGVPLAGRSIMNRPLTMSGRVYEHGVGTHADSEMSVNLHRQAERFEAVVGIDDAALEGKRMTTSRFATCVFEVWGDERKLAETKVLHVGDAPVPLSVDLRGVERLTLVVRATDDGNNWDHANWADAVIRLKPDAAARPVAFIPPVEPAAPIVRRDLRTLAINGPRVVGATPRRPFMFKVAVVGEAPIEVAARDLPAGLAIDARTGVISGRIEREGVSVVRIEASNRNGRATRYVVIVAGENRLALTPPMGWNSWNVWGATVSADKVRAAADAMVATGLAAHGYAYVNLDDGWQAGRDAAGEMRTNDKFPDMRALADYVHEKGLKFGIYSSPGPKTCADFEGSYRHEERDAQTFARWGADYLKYDWCSYRDIAKDMSLPELQKPYQIMHDALERTNRDIVYSLCQYGMGDVWKWGDAVGGDLWRTTGDISDTWGSMSYIGFVQAERLPHTGASRWIDPDMLVLGKLGWGTDMRDSRLKPNEQITHVTLWSLMPAPLIVGTDLARLDDFTLDLLMNREVLAVNQDPLGTPARRVWRANDLEVWARPLADGTIAVGLFNRGRERAKVTARWSDMGLQTGTQPVRDLWQQKSLGNHSDEFSATLPSHGAAFIKVGSPTRGDKQIAALLAEKYKTEISVTRTARE